MPTPENLKEDAAFLLKKVTFLDGHELKSLCRDLGLPVTNMGRGDMIERIVDKLGGEIESYCKMPSRESERALRLFRYNVLPKSKFLERYLEKVKRYKPD